MPKRSVKQSNQVRDGERLPAELDFKKLKFVGFGLDALDRYEADKARTIILDPDVAEVFENGAAVNSILRAIIQGATLTRKSKQKKSA